MSAPRTFLGSTIGKKVIMATTGVALVGFVVGHMAGNLQLYMGAEALNAYGEFLHHFLHGQGLWVARIGLLACLGLHLWSAISLTMANQAARPVGYRQWQADASTYASRTMRWSGPILLAFIVYHLLHFTVGSAHPDFRAGDVYHNVVVGFRSVPVAVAYIVAMVLLGLHLRHGIWSMTRTLGLSHPRYLRIAQHAATLLTAAVVAGNISFPVAVLLGLVH